MQEEGMAWDPRIHHQKTGFCEGTHSHSFSLRSEAPGRLTVLVKHYGPLKPFECIPSQS
jgi:hypothetical protein